MAHDESTDGEDGDGPGIKPEKSKGRAEREVGQLPPSCSTTCMSWPAQPASAWHHSAVGECAVHHTLLYITLWYGSARECAGMCRSCCCH